MSRTQVFVKATFNDYFDRLKEIAQTIEQLKKCSPKQEREMQKLVAELERELKTYASELKTGGQEIIRRVA